MLHSFAAAGGRSFVQWSPYGTGRGNDVLAGLSRATGVHVVAATGLHQSVHYDRALLDGLYEGLAELFTAELTTGLRGAPDGTRAGLIKVAGDNGPMTGHTRRVLRAAAEAHHATGAPIAVHHDAGTDPVAVLFQLGSRFHVPPERLILGHLNRLPALEPIREFADLGVFVALDAPPRATPPRSGTCSTSSPPCSTPATPTGSCSVPTPPPAPPGTPPAPPTC
ncbi:hypothetical protein ACFQ0M_36495 [Kitasatospora aburaviensis]